MPILLPNLTGHYFTLCAHSGMRLALPDCIQGIPIRNVQAYDCSDTANAVRTVCHTVLTYYSYLLFDSVRSGQMYLVCSAMLHPSFSYFESRFPFFDLLNHAYIPFVFCYVCIKFVRGVCRMNDFCVYMVVRSTFHVHCLRTYWYISTLKNYC